MFAKHPAIIALIAAVLFFGVTSTLALADKGGNASGKSGSSSISLVIVGSSTGTTTAVPTWGQVVTFAVSTTAAYPYVTLNCYRNGAWVYTMSAGAWPEAPGTHYFSLGSSSWTSGSADCTADLHYTTSSGKKVTLATLDFHVGG